MSHGSFQGSDLPHDAVASDAAADTLIKQNLRQGDVNDDDPSVLESHMVERDAPPATEPSIPEVLVEEPKRNRPTTTRVLTGSQALPIGRTTAFRVFPEDPRRKNVVLLVTGTAPDFIIWADDIAKLESPDGTVVPPGAGIVPAGSGPYVIDGHTGPVYVAAFNLAAVARVAWHSVTL